MKEKENAMGISETQTQALLLVILIVLAFFFLYFVITMGESPTAYYGTTPIVCPVGTCATNIYNGEKRCTTSGGNVLANPKSEVCNSQFICDNPLTPFALLSDGSTTATGVCESGVTCRCLRRQQCPNYVVAIYNTINGTPFTDLNGTRTAFIQTSSSLDLSGNVTSVPPLTFDNTTTTFCAVPLDFVNRSSPGCSDIQMTSANIASCMFNENPCIIGTLAFIPENSDTFNTPQVETTPLSCVRGVKCASGQVAVWNKELDSLICKTLS